MFVDAKLWIDSATWENTGTGEYLAIVEANTMDEISGSVQILTKSTWATKPLYTQVLPHTVLQYIKFIDSVDNCYENKKHLACHKGNNTLPE